MSIRSSGMEGFSEAGIPSDWDFSIGEVYGYRWWKMHLPCEIAGYAPVRTDPNACDFDFAEPLEGANRKRWSSGRLEATCAPNASWLNISTSNSWFRHEPPEYRVACGCGFWAYFDPQLEASRVLGGIKKGAPQRTGAIITIPVFGVIKGTGRIIIGDKGFRSQYAEIVGLCLSDWAVDNLSHELAEIPRFKADTSTYGRLFAALKGNVVTSNGYVDGYYSDADLEHTLAPKDIIMRRIALTEAILSTAYPKAKVLCDQDALTAYFAPDTNYGPGSAFQLDNKYGPA